MWLWLIKFLRFIGLRKLSDEMETDYLFDKYRNVTTEDFYKLAGDDMHAPYQPDQQFVPRLICFSLKDEFNKREVAQLLADKYGGELHPIEGDDIRRAAFEVGKEDQIVEKLKQEPTVKWAEREYAVHLMDKAN